MTSRRSFLAACLAGSLAQARAARVPVIDTHIHCFAGPDDRRFPYHKDAPYRPPVKATPQELLAAMTDGGVSGAVIVHPEPYQDDHRYLEYCLALDRKRLRGTCLFFADREDAVANLQALVKRCPGIVTLRIHAYAPERQPPFGKPALKALWKAAADAGLAIQLHFEPRYAPGFEPYIKEFAKTTVIIDHLGRPIQGTPKEHAVVVGWARHPNTIIKLSSVPESDRYPHRKIGPIIRQLATAFGSERMIYGGGWKAGVTGKGYRADRERLAAYLDHLSERDRAAIFGGNAARLFKFM